jgi:hypothetical protein
MQSGFFPRISTQAYTAVFSWDAPVQAAVPPTPSQPRRQVAHNDLVELLQYLRSKDVDGIYSGAEVLRGDLGHKLQLPDTFRSVLICGVLWFPILYFHFHVLKVMALGKVVPSRCSIPLLHCLYTPDSVCSPTP